MKFVKTLASFLLAAQLITPTLAWTATDRQLEAKTIKYPKGGVMTVPNATDTFVGKATTDTLTNKTLASPIITGANYTGADNVFTLQDNSDATKQFNFELSSITTGTSRTLTVPNANGTIATLAGTETLANKTLTSPTITAKDNVVTLQDDGDATKQLNFQLSSITAGNTRTLTVPDANGTIATLAGTETFTNKILTSPTINTPNITVKDNVFTLQDNGDATKQLNLELSGITTGTSRTLTVPNANGTIATLAGTETLANKTLTTPVLSQTAAAKTANYTVTTSDHFLTGDSSGAAFTFTLPTVASASGMTFRFKKIDTSLNAITLDGDGSETIDGATTTTLNTQYEEVTIFSNGSAWYVVNRTIPSEWTSFTPTLVNFTPSGSGNETSGKWRRVGDSIQVTYYFNLGNGGSGSAGTATMTIPNSATWTIDTAKMARTGGFQICGSGLWVDVSGTGLFTSQLVQVASTTTLRWASHGATAVFNGSSITADDQIGGTYTVPITGWH